MDGYIIMQSRHFSKKIKPSPKYFEMRMEYTIGPRFMIAPAPAPPAAHKYFL